MNDEFPLSVETQLGEDGGENEEIPVTNLYLKSLIREGEMDTLGRLIKIKAAVIPTRWSDKIRLLNHVRLIEKDVDTVVCLIDNSPRMPLRIVNHCLNNPPLFEIILKTIVEKRDEIKKNEYAQALESSFNNSKYQDLLKNVSISRFVEALIGEKLFLIRWKHGYHDEVFRRISEISNNSISQMLLTACVSDNLPVFKKLYDMNYSIPIYPSVITSLASRGLYEVIDYIHSNNPLINIDKICCSTAVDDEIDGLVLGNYVKWLNKKGFLANLNRSALLQLCFLLVKNEDISTVNEVVSVQPPDILDLIFSESSPNFIRQLVEFRVINSYRVPVIKGYTGRIISRTSFLLSAIDSILTSSPGEQVLVILSLVRMCAEHNDMLGTDILGRYPHIAKDYGNHIFSTVAKHGVAEDMIRYLVNAGSISWSPSLLLPLCTPKSIELLIYVVFAFSKTKTDLDFCLGDLFRKFISEKKYLLEFSLFLRTRYSGKFNLSNNDIQRMSDEHVFVLLESHPSSASISCPKPLLNKLIRRLLVARTFQTERLYELFKIHSSQLDDINREVFVRFDCFFGTSEYLYTMEDIPEDCLLQLFASGAICKLKNILNKYKINGTVEASEVFVLKDLIYLKSKDIYLLKHYSIFCRKCGLRADNPMCIPDSGHGEYYCQLHSTSEMTKPSCPICQSDKVKLFSISCGHVFCLTCLESLIKSRKTNCPMCRSEWFLQEFFFDLWRIPSGST